MIVKNKVKDLWDHFYDAISESADGWYLTLISTFRPQDKGHIHLKHYSKNLLEGMTIQYDDPIKAKELDDQILELKKSSGI